MINQIEPWITNLEIESVHECISSTFVTESRFTNEFELKIQALHRTALQPIAYSNATMGLYAALIALGIQRGQEVIIPALTFVATANAVIMAGGVPRTVDINNDFNFDLDQLRDAINPNTFAIMPVHLYGHFTNVFDVAKIAKQYGLYVIEDASQGVGVCDDNGNYAGTIGDIGVLSFYGNKFVTSAQGGMLICDELELSNKLRRLKNHGRTSKGTFWHEEIGYNFCTSDLHSALGLAQLERFEEIRHRKQEIFDIYSEHLSPSTSIKLDKIISQKPAYWFISIFYEDVEYLSTALRAYDIQTRRAFPPLSFQPCFQNTNIILHSSDKGAQQIYNTYLSLPSAATLTDQDIIQVCDAIKSIIMKE